MRLRLPSLLVPLLVAAAATAAAGLPASAAAATGIAFARAPGAPFATGGAAALDVAVADFNGDGHPDLAVTVRESGVVVLDGDGNGGFHDPRTVFANFAVAVLTADFNGDGHPDLAISAAKTSSSSAGIYVLLGRGDGTFAPGPSPATGVLGGVDEMAVADFNRDGHPDIASARSAGSESERGVVNVLLGDGHGGMTPAPGSPFPAGVDDPTAITTLDANRDGWPDVALSDDALEVGRVSVLLGSSNGLSPAGRPFRIGHTSGGFDVKFPRVIRAGDLNGDHKPDLVVATGGNSDDPNAGATLALLRGNGSGGFTPMPDRGPAMGPRTGIGGIRLADLDADGHLDVAAMVQGGAQPGLRVLTGDGHGSLTPLATAFPEPIGGLDFAMADLNGDHRPDVITPGAGTGTVDVLLNLAPTVQIGTVSLGSLIQSGLPVTVGCSAACTLETDVLLGASAARARRPVLLGRATTRLGRRGRKRIRVRLTSHGRTRLRGARRATLTVKTSALTRGRPKGRPATRTLVLHR